MMMKKIFLMLIIGFLGMACVQSQSLELEKIHEWKNEEHGMGLNPRTYTISALGKHQLFYIEYPEENDEDVSFFLKNYRTGEITHRFEGPVRLFGDSQRGFIEDQYGKYIFFERDNKPVLFDVESKREVQSGEELKRPEVIYYTVEERQKIQNIYKIAKHNLQTNKIVMIDLKDEDIPFSLSRAYQTMEDIGNNQLRLYSNYISMIITFDKDMMHILDITENEIRYDKDVNFSVYLAKHNYLGFRSIPELSDDAGTGYYVLLFDESGKVVKEYREIVMSQNGVMDVNATYMSLLCLLSPDKREVLFFEYLGGELTRAEVYRVVYGDEKGKACIGVRPLSILSSRSLESKVVKEISSTVRMKILERSNQTATKDGIESNWYQVEIGNVKGWVLGKDIAILEAPNELSQGIINDQNVRLREAPNLTGKQLRLLNKGTQVTIEEETLETMKIGELNSVWYKVKLESGESGWVYGAYVEIK